jgi:flagellin
MDVNSINNSIANLNNVPQQGLESNNHINNTKKITNDEAVNVNISSSYQKQRDELSQSLQHLNEGIAITEIGKQGLEKQEDILKTLQEDLYRINNEETLSLNADTIKTNIAKGLQEFNTIAQDTRFQNEQILTANEESRSVNISTKDKTFSIDPVNTQAISSSLAQNIYNNPLESSEDVNKAIGDIQTAVGHTSSLSERFSKLEKEIENSARDTITEQINLSRQNSKLRDIDFGAETTDFSKTNINTNLGFLAGSQANIIQEQTVRLIAK